MTPEVWGRLKTLFNEALEKPWQERKAFLANACGGDLPLRRELFALIEVHEGQLPITEVMASEIYRLVISAAPRSLASGDLILGRFEIVRRLGSGGMGDVYEALDRELHQTVALKRIHPEMAGNESFLGQFKREVQLARRLSGPNICRIHELFVAKENEGLVEDAFLTMELLEGTTLADKLKGGPLPWREAHAIAMDICAGLAVMHKAGIIHRDLKSCNIMLANRDGAQRAVLMDFGLAHDLSQSSPKTETVLTNPGVVQGTPEYMAPEQFEGRAATPASDVYAVGVILYELITGKHPFASSNPLGAAVLRGKRLAPASSVTHNVPRRWDVAIRACLEYEATQRYQSVDELARALTGNTFGVRVLQERRSGLLLAAAGLALVVAFTWFILALRQEIEGVDLMNHERHVAVHPFDTAVNSQQASILADRLMDSLAGKLSSPAPGNKAFWVVPPSEIRRREVNDPGTALLASGGTVVVKGQFICDRGTLRLNLELIDSKGMREIGYAEIENHEQDLCALQNEAVTHLSRLMSGNPAVVAKHVDQPLTP